MKYALIFLVALLVNDPIKINKINKIKSEAKDAFQAGDYKGAAAKYKLLVDSLGVKEDEVLLNLAHANFLMKDTASAFSNYQTLTRSNKKEIVSKANQQLGVMANQQGKAEEALSYFKQAVKADPTNESARYDYEMLKKKLDEKKKQEQKQNKDQQQNKDQNKDQQNKDQQKKEEQKKEDQKKEQDKKDQENKDQQNKDQKKDEKNKDQQQKDKEKKEQEEKEKKEQQEKQQQEKDQKDQKKPDPRFDPEKMPKISEEKARMILEAMKNQEKQYLQQNKRKATKSRDRNKPDW